METARAKRSSMQTHLFSFLVIGCLLFAPILHAQENSLNDPDLKEMLKEAQEMQKEAKKLQKQNPTSQDTKKKLAEMLSQDTGYTRIQGRRGTSKKNRG